MLSTDYIHFTVVSKEVASLYPSFICIHTAFLNFLSIRQTIVKEPTPDEVTNSGRTLHTSLLAACLAEADCYDLSFYWRHWKVGKKGE